MSEKAVEQFLVSEVSKLGGWCPKWSATGQRGVPDRIVFMPSGYVYFVEVKQAKGQLSAQQKMVHKKLRNLGADVYVLWSKTDVLAFVDEISEETTWVE